MNAATAIVRLRAFLDAIDDAPDDVISIAPGPHGAACPLYAADLTALLNALSARRTTTDGTEYWRQNMHLAYSNNDDTPVQVDIIATESLNDAPPRRMPTAQEANDALREQLQEDMESEEDDASSGLIDEDDPEIDGLPIKFVPGDEMTETEASDAYILKQRRTQNEFNEETTDD